MKSNPFKLLVEFVDRLVNATLPIRVSGEMGAGKAAVARLIFDQYPHKNALFLKFNCKTLKLQLENPETAKPNGSSQPSLPQALTASRHQVFYLEHVDCLPASLHGSLLRVFDRGHSPQPPWIIVSSVKPLEHYVEDEDFNRALFSGLDAIRIALPPPTAKLQRMLNLASRIRNQYRKKNSAGQPSIPDAKTIHILSLAKVQVRKERLLEALMAASNLEKIGLLDLAIFNEAVSQISDCIEAWNCDRKYSILNF